jgi:hypothetical protein
MLISELLKNLKNAPIKILTKCDGNMHFCLFFGAFFEIFQRILYLHKFPRVRDLYFFFKAKIVVPQPPHNLDNMHCTYKISLYKGTLLLNAKCWWWHLCFGNDHLDHHKLEMTRPRLTPFPLPYPPFPHPSLNSCPHHSHLFYSCLLSFSF